MDKKYKNLIVIGIIGIILALISATYAYWMITKTQTNSNIITSKCLDISITGETNDINLVDAYPITDEEGEATIPYSFTITNNCNSAVDYQVALESIGNASESLQPSSIKAKLDNRGAVTIDHYSSIETTIENAYDSHLLATGTLEASGEEGSTKTYSLRLWIDSNSPLSENGKIFESKISVNVGENIQTSICKGVTASTLTTGNIPTGDYNYGDEYICTLGREEYHFFILEDGDNTNLEKGVTGTAGPGEVSLIMNKNIGSKVAWCADETRCKTNGNWDNTKGPITAKEYLKNQTSNWWVMVDLPTKEQISSVFIGTMPTWLYDYLNGTTHSVSGVYGYWTASPYDANSGGAWRVSCYGSVYSIYVGSNDSTGVRPVITISKSYIN